MSSVDSIKTTKKTTITIHPGRRFVVALMIILPSFLFIGYMIYLQETSLETTIDNIKEIPGEMSVNATKEILKSTFEEHNKNRQNLLNSLLPLFAAWVGAVVAFYFGSENLEQAQKTLAKVMSPEQKLSSKSISDLLQEHPSVKSIVTVTMDYEIGDVKTKFSNGTNVLVVKTENKPLGILYSSDLAKQGGVNLYEPDSTNDKNALSSVIVKIKSDKIKKSPWTSDGIKNFASLYLDDNLLQAKNKMKEMAVSDENILSVRGVVLDKDDKAVAIVNFANISSGII